MRYLHLLLSFPLLCLSACKESNPEPVAPDMSMMELEMEDEEFGLSIRSEPRLKKGENNGEPFTMEVLDDTANPVFSRHLLTTDEIANGWISLFDGATLFGWESNNPEVNWKVENGLLTADVGPVGLLQTTVPFVDYELVCEYKIAAGGNSGIFLRSIPNPKNLKEDCLELNIASEHPEGYITGSFVERKKTTAPLAESKEWQTFRIVAIGNRFMVELNDELVLEYTDDNPAFRRAGLIGLQQRIGKVEFRKVNLKPLTMKTLFNISTLAGWHEVPGSKAKFTIEEDTIHVFGGAGFLETDQVFKDFMFQTQVQTGAREINSGYFFRAEKGTEAAPSNGYEVQVHNGFSANDRDRPSNAGSGAIFRRADARRVVANDLEWYTMTLVACGPRYAVWVDGYEVVDWVDTRAANPNPRKGLRLEAGHISLQGHDPTTDAYFRQLKIAEYPDSTPATAP